MNECIYNCEMIMILCRSLRMIMIFYTISKDNDNLAYPRYSIILQIYKYDRSLEK